MGRLKSKMRRMLPILFLLAGLALLVIGLVLGTQPWRSVYGATEILTELKTQIEAGNFSLNASDMPTVEVDGYDYIGYLSNPEMDRTLPVMADLTDEKLEVSPCRYYGFVVVGNRAILSSLPTPTAMSFAI